MECIQEDGNPEEYLPIDLVDENYAEEDDMNDGVPVQELAESSGTDTGAGGDCIPIKDYSLNHEYMKNLRELRRAIEVEIQRCREKQEILARRIKELDKQPVNPVARKNWYHLFGYPYFKDKCFFPCPINDDYRQKLSKNEIDYHKLKPIRRWTESECLKLEKAVKENAIERRSSGLMTRRGLVVDKLMVPNLKLEEKSALNDEVISIDNAINKIKKLDSNTLYGDKSTQFDWLKITAEVFGQYRSSEEVQAMWVLCRHPSINRKHWTRDENTALSDIAKRFKEQDWECIAEELNTSRSEFQCVVQYQRKVNTDFINHRWTEAEDEMLKYLVGRCQVNGYVPWGTIAMCMRNRTRQQVYSRWMLCINPSIRKGRFTVEEDCLIVAGVKHFGQDFARIAELLPGRTSAQLNNRYKMCLSRDGPLGQWSVEEDLRLLKLVELHGKKWQWLALEHFRTRSRSQIRHRFMYLEEWLNKNPDCSVSKAPRRDLGDAKRRNFNLWSTIQNALTRSNRKRREPKEIDEEDLEWLRMTMESSTQKIKRAKGIGRKKKIFSKAEKLLHQIAKVCYIWTSGRSKAVFTEEEFQKRQSMVLKLLNVLQSHLAFPFDESVIQDDPVWNISDQSILLELKEKYDQCASVGGSHNRSIADKSEASSVSTANGVTTNRAGVPHSPSFVPLYRSQEETKTSFPEIFPGFIGNSVGFRTMLLSRQNLRMWKSVPANESLALPAMRPSSEALQEKGVPCFSKEESAKLFSERLFSLFFWPTQLVRQGPDFDDGKFLQPDSSEKNSNPAQKRKRRTMKDQARSKKFSMRERWKKIRQEKGKKSSESAHSSTKGAAKKRKAELNLL